MKCKHCGEEIELHYTSQNRRDNYAYWRHVASGRRSCLVVQHMASPSSDDC